MKIDLGKTNAHLKLELDIHTNLKDANKVIENLCDTLAKELQKIIVDNDMCDITLTPTLTILDDK